ncbi:transcription factor dpl-1 [Mayamaea pseudoterrestris]|nr:transcription factor dpl-1 [Mayamaea pseudoterrestris]
MSFETTGSNPRKRPIEEQASDVPMEVEVATGASSPLLLPSADAATAASSTSVPKRPDSKAYKGLRHFSMMVCRTVEEKTTTTYNEVADELVERIVHDRQKDDPSGKFDEKNIRRRVYDALNVLMAMDIITKDKKSITWKGLPSAAGQDIDMLHREREFRLQEVQRKRESLKELLQQQVCYRNLVQHNQSQNHDSEHNKIPLPFILVNTHNSAVIQCNMSRDKQDVMFDFSMPFEINDDNGILKRMGLDKTTTGVLSEMLPPDMLKYCQDNHLLDSMVVDDADAVVGEHVDAAAIGSSHHGE